jgi:hypothetical protein
MMKSVYIAGSRKFHADIEKLVQQLREYKINASNAGKWNRAQPDTTESEKRALLDAFRKIDEFDICYIYARDGYIGRTVAMEIAYAYSRKKELISSHKIEELSAQGLVARIMNPEELVRHCSQHS